METAKLPMKIFQKYSEYVYEPSEDTFLLLDALEQELNKIKSLKPLICVEIGSGSGTVITSLANALGSKDCLYIATDINRKALQCTLECFQHNIPKGLATIQLIQCNLADALRLNKSANLILFNPPYVPTEETEMINSHIEKSWAGGRNGRKTIDCFITETLKKNLDPNGLAYLVAIEQNDIDDIIQMANSVGLQCQSINRRKCGIEKLSILKFQHKLGK